MYKFIHIIYIYPKWNWIDVDLHSQGNYFDTLSIQLTLLVLHIHNTESVHLFHFVLPFYFWRKPVFYAYFTLHLIFDELKCHYHHDIYSQYVASDTKTNRIHKTSAENSSTVITLVHIMA